jgi:hypothetical protein
VSDAEHRQTNEGLLALASNLAESAGKGRARSLWRLAGGKNNQVYRVEMEAGTPLVLKRYFSDPRDSRNRLATEWNFLNHVWSCGIRAVPQPLARDAASHTALYSFAGGRKLLASELKDAHIDAAIDFILAMDVRCRAPLAPASEACFTLAEHIATIERRVVRVMTLNPDGPYAREAQSFVSTRLLPAWNEVKSHLMADACAAGLSMDRELGPDDCCLSPSDFGFHNALVDDQGGVTFLDFEYAGRDDPAKLVSDFFCQPEIPVPLEYHAHFVARISDGFALTETAQARCRMLLDAYRIKWTCIILNDFLPLGVARRAFADAGTWSTRCASQLTKAAASLPPLA